MLPKLGSYQSMTWPEIDDRVGGRTGCHSIPVTEIIREAQTRLLDIGQDDIDELFSFRITGKCRVWGIREGDVFHLLWCDPEHEICPSPLKHT